jgi:hypothetical protein
MVDENVPHLPAPTLEMAVSWACALYAVGVDVNTQNTVFLHCMDVRVCGHQSTLNKGNADQWLCRH